MRDGPADKLDVGHFVHPETVSLQSAVSSDHYTVSSYLILRGREKKIQTGGQTTIVKNSRISFRLFPVQLRPPRQSSFK